MEDRRRFGGFLLVGVISTLCNLVSRYFFEIGLSYEWALVGANTVGVVTAFLMNRAFVFNSTGAGFGREFTRFAAVNLVGIAMSWVTAVLLFRWFFPAVNFVWHPDLMAHAIGIAVPVVPNYLAHKAWTFNQSVRR